MKVTITSKNIKTNDYLKETVEKKMQKLGKYFSDDIGVNVMLSEEAQKEKIEATIKVRGMIFRAECKSDDIYESLDKVVDKLAAQMSKFKGKLQRKHKDNKQILFAQWPDAPDANEAEELDVVKKKSFELSPMLVDEAVLQMEMLEHNFYVFLNTDTNEVNVVYKRSNGNYGLLETTR
ncbi:MAG: ribosome-associated translation inhibitor RaiA [Anaerovoracaceae bacterium]